MWDIIKGHLIALLNNQGCNGPVSFVVGSPASELQEFGARASDGMGPVDGTFGLAYASGNFIEEIGGWYWAIEGS